MKNTIIADIPGANSTSGVNCVGPIKANSYNISTDGSCGNATQRTFTQINLGPLADNGGTTETMSPLPGSAAINMGDNAACAAAPVNNLDQRGVNRPEGDQCEVGAYEVDIPIVASIKRLDTNPSLVPIVNFLVIFSESVTGVDITDLKLKTLGKVSNSTVDTISGSDGTYTVTVTVNSGLGNGTLRLDLMDDGSIEDSSSNTLGGIGVENRSFINGEIYTITIPLPAPVLNKPSDTSI